MITQVGRFEPAAAPRSCGNRARWWGRLGVPGAPREVPSHHASCPGRMSLPAPQTHAGFKNPPASFSPASWNRSAGLADAAKGWPLPCRLYPFPRAGSQGLQSCLHQGGSPKGTDPPPNLQSTKGNVCPTTTTTTTTPWPVSHFCTHPLTSQGENTSWLCPREPPSPNAAGTQLGQTVPWSHSETLLHLPHECLSLSCPGPGQAPGALTEAPDSCLPGKAPAAAWAGSVPLASLSLGLVPPGCAAPAPYRFGRDVCVGEAPVLAHDGDVAVDIDRQRVAGQHRDPAGESPCQRPGRPRPCRGSGAGAALTPSRPC